MEQLVDLIDQAISTDPHFGTTVSTATWRDYRAQIADYDTWLTNTNHRHDRWSDPEVFEAYLKSLELSDAALAKRCTAVNKLSAAARITGADVTTPTRTMAIQTVRAKASAASQPDIDAIDPNRNYSITNAAQALGVSTRTVRRRIDDAQFPTARLEPGPDGPTWTIPGHELRQTFAPTPKPIEQPLRRPETATANELDLIVQAIDTATAAGLRDRAALRIGIQTQLSETAIARLQLQDLTTPREPLTLPSRTADVNDWITFLQQAGATPTTTLWPAINRANTLKLNSTPVRVGTIIRTRLANAGISINGLRQLRQIASQDDRT